MTKAKHKLIQFMSFGIAYERAVIGWLDELEEVRRTS